MTMPVLEKYFCLFLLAAVPISYFPITHNPVLIKSLLIGLTVLFWLVVKINDEKASFSSSWDITGVCLLLWISVNFISLGLSSSAYVNYPYLGEMLAMAGVYYLFQSGALVLSSENLLRTVNVASFFVMLWGGVQFFKGYYKPVSTFGNPNYFGAFLVSVWPLLILAAKQGGRWDRYLALLNAGLFAFMTYYIHSLGMILSIVLSVFLLIWLYSGELRKRFIFLLAGALICVAVLNMPSVNRQFLHHVSSDIRPFIWKGVYHLILVHPWLGCGPGNFQIFYPEYRIPEYFTHPLSVDNTDHAHCEALEIMAETGVMGFSIFIIFLCAIFMKALKNFKNLNHDQKLLSGSLFIGIALLLFENLFDVNLRHASSKFMLWSFLGLTAGLSGMKKSLNVRIFQWPYARWVVILTATVIFYLGFARVYCADIFFKEGIQARNENDYETAIHRYRQAVRIDPYHLEARYRLGFLYGSSGYVDKGIREYTNLMQLAPYFASVHNNLAILYSKGDNLNLAEHHYRVQLRLNPYNAETYCGLASVLLRENKKEEAVQLLRHALILKPGHPFATQILSEIRHSA